MQKLGENKTTSNLNVFLYLMNSLKWIKNEIEFTIIDQVRIIVKIKDKMNKSWIKKELKNLNKRKEKRKRNQ